jgi:NADH-quinone oxidoreductase subunit F
MSSVIANRAQLEQRQAEIRARRDPNRKAIAICGGTGCTAYGGQSLTTAFREAVKAKGLDVEVRVTGCHGFCERGPLVVVFPWKIFYQEVGRKNAQKSTMPLPEWATKADLLASWGERGASLQNVARDVDEILETLRSDAPADRGDQVPVVERLLHRDAATGQVVRFEHDVPFYRHQQRIILGFNGSIDPESLDDYLALGGYGALARALTELQPGQVIDTVEQAGLRGRGGAGFPTGRKWRFARAAEGSPKYVVCNADEGDPGAFMDRSVLEGNPHGVVEGMLIGAYAIGASQGYVYVRNEYPLAVERLTRAIHDARAAGLLGDNLLGTNFSFDIKITRGAGAFVCGEETALIGSVEGNRGQPRFRPPYPAQKGLWGQPTVINNVETWVNVPLILGRGAEWFAGIGTKSSKGTKIFSLVGKVNNTGLVEVPMGASLRHIVFDIGGGIKDGRRFKAIQTGGPSGGCLPESRLDLEVDFDTLAANGSMMGSGGMIVVDDRTCIVDDVARFYVDFLIEESCGKCTPCREGLLQMSHLLHDVVEGRADEGTLDRLTALASVVKDASLCALGQTAPNPVLSTIQHWHDEYLAHIRDHKCPAGRCKAFITYTITDRCTGCTICARECPEKIITGEKKALHVIDTDKCTRCGVCYSVCTFDAIEVA